MFTVALIGPDGAGKTTISRQLEHRLPVPVKYLYMGVSTDASNRMLPSTRLIRAVKRALGGKPDQGGPRDPDKTAERPRGMIRRWSRSLRTGLSLANRMTDEWFRQCLAWYYRCRGYIVLFDRHYFVDYYAYDIAPTTEHRPLARRVHGFMLQRVYPKPELVIYLDAAAETLFARKGEGTIELLERRRQEYLEIRHHVSNFAVVDANQPPERVLQDVSQLITRHYAAKKMGQTAGVSAAADLHARRAECERRAVWPELAVLDLKAEADQLHVDS